MFSLFFKDLDIDNYKCDVFEFAKHKHVSFPISIKRTTIPFNLIHVTFGDLSLFPTYLGLNDLIRSLMIVHV